MADINSMLNPLIKYIILINLIKLAIIQMMFIPQYNIIILLIKTI